MTIGYIGLGKMGKNMVLRLLEKKIAVVAWNRSPEPIEEVVKAGAMRATDLQDLILKLPTPRIIWLMLPAGQVMDDFIEQLMLHLSPGDLLIDGTNSFYKDTLRRAKTVSKKKIKYMDVAVSGGPRGARNGACLLIGGETTDVQNIKPLLTALAAPTAFAHLGPVGAGHFAKMIHNGIEYGMMQAIAEGAAVLKKSAFKYDFAQVFGIYNTGSVIESKLIGWTQEIFAENPKLTGISSTIGMLGEGEWTVNTAKELQVPTPIIEESVNVRIRSAKEKPNFRNKVVTALRGKFGGHSTK